METLTVFLLAIQEHLLDYGVLHDKVQKPPKERVNGAELQATQLALDIAE